MHQERLSVRARQPGTDTQGACSLKSGDVAVSGGVAGREKRQLSVRRVARPLA